MDIELLKTFLEVERTGHFGHAAEVLYLTPAAVSARIRQLEGTLGQPLFYRDRKRVTLTPAGERLKPYAEQILDTWKTALRESPPPAGANNLLSVGSTPNLWDLFLQDYLLTLHREYPELQLRAACHDGNCLTSQLQHGQLDMTVQLEPLKLDGIAREKVGEFELVMVSTQRDLGLEDLPRFPYVQVDWSARFILEHQQAPGTGLCRPDLFTSAGKVGLNFILANGGSMYLPDFLAGEMLHTSRLFQVAGARAIVQPFYVSYREDGSRESLIADLIKLLARVPARRPRADLESC